jgi:hypothetical protein
MEILLSRCFRIFVVVRCTGFLSRTEQICFYYDLFAGGREDRTEARIFTRIFG